MGEQDDRAGGGDVNVADLLRDSAQAHPDRPALLFQEGRLTFSQLDANTDRAAAALSGQGVRRGDRVALLVGNVPEFVSALYGILRIGAVACPLNIMLTPEELGYILADAGAKAVVTDRPSLPGLLAIRDRLSDLHTITVLGGGPTPRGTVPLDDATTGKESVPSDSGAGRGEDLAVIAYTSGTTAAPKGAMLTHGNLSANLSQMSAVPALALTPDDVVLLALPMFHSYGLNGGLGMALNHGAACLLMERFEAAESLDLIQRHRVTVLVGAPPMFAAWLGLREPAPDLSSVRLAVSGASPLSPETLSGFRDRFGITIWEGYGLTECAPAVTSNAVGPHAKAGSIGLPLPGVDVRLVGEGLEDLEDDDPGEIQVRGPNVFSGYWARPEATAEAFDGEWFKTGDVAIRDEEGYLFLVDRKKDLIIVSGFNVYPIEVEEAIARHPKVADAAVVGIPDPRTGEAVQAWVVPRPGQDVTEHEILDFLHGYLARFKWPKEIRIVEEVPRQSSGKLMRRVLRGEEILGSPQVSEESTA